MRKLMFGAVLAALALAACAPRESHGPANMVEGNRTYDDGAQK